MHRLFIVITVITTHLERAALHEDHLERYAADRKRLVLSEGKRHRRHVSALHTYIYIFLPTLLAALHGIRRVAAKGKRALKARGGDLRAVYIDVCSLGRSNRDGLAAL